MIGHLGTQQMAAVSLGSLAVSFATFTFGFLVFLTTPKVRAARVGGPEGRRQAGATGVGDVPARRRSAAALRSRE